ncbi:unnamed protein product [Calypogeia fissa]
MEEEGRERTKNTAKRELKRKLSSRKRELKHADRVMKWKASAAGEPASAAPYEKQTMAEMVRASAKRGPKHDLYEELRCNIEILCAHRLPRDRMHKMLLRNAREVRIDDMEVEAKTRKRNSELSY